MDQKQPFAPRPGAAGGLRSGRSRRPAVVALLTAWGLAAGLLTGAVSAPAEPAAAATAPQIWPLGDSITLGLSGGAAAAGTTAEGSTPGGYRAPLDADLSQDGVAHLFVGTSTANSTPVLTAEGQNHHDGHSGYRIDQDAADLDGVAGGPTDDGGYWMTRSSDPIRPDLVIVLLGSNDILQHYDPATRFPTATGQADYSDPAQVATFVSDMTARLQSLIGRIENLQPGTRLVLSDVPPIGTGKADTVTGPYATAVRNLAAQESRAGVDVAFVDVYSQFVESTAQGEVVVPGMIGPDGVHPTPAGYQVMAGVYRTAVESMLAP